MLLNNYLLPNYFKFHKDKLLEFDKKNKLYKNNSSGGLSDYWSCAYEIYKKDEFHNQYDFKEWKKVSEEFLKIHKNFENHSFDTKNLNIKNLSDFKRNKFFIRKRYI